MSDATTVKKNIVGEMELTCDSCHRLISCQFLLDLEGQVVEQKLKCPVCGDECEIDDELRRTFELEYVRYKQRQKRFWARVKYSISVVLSAIPTMITVACPVAYFAICRPSLNAQSVIVATLMWVIVWIVGMKVFRKPTRFRKVLRNN